MSTNYILSTEDNQIELDNASEMDVLDWIEDVMHYDIKDQDERPINSLDEYTIQQLANSGYYLSQPLN